MPLPVNQGFEARIGTINTGIAGLPGIFNPRRRSLAFDAAARLNEQGFSADAMPTEVNEGGNLTYRLTRGADGRLYFQAYRKISTGHGGRGTFYSSFHQRDQREGRRDIDAARNELMRSFASQQQGLTDQQADESRRLFGDLGAARGDYAQWQSDQEKLAEPQAPAAAGPAGPAAVPARTTPAQSPGVGRMWTGQNAPDRAHLSRAWGVPAGRIRVNRLPDGRFQAYIYNA